MPAMCIAGFYMNFEHNFLVFDPALRRRAIQADEGLPAFFDLAQGIIAGFSLGVIVAFLVYIFIYITVIRKDDAEQENYEASKQGKRKDSE